MEEEQKQKPKVRKQSPQKKTPIHIKNKHTDDLIDHYWGSINYGTNLIKASEIKAGLILSFYGIILNLLYQNIHFIEISNTNKIVIYGLLILWFGCTVISIYFSIRCFIPRIEAKHDKNIFFFKDIISKFGTINEFSKTFYEVSSDEDQLFMQLGQQIFVISKIATVKFKDVNRSLRFLAVGIFLLLIMGSYYAIVTL
jgi:hypothetical protein